MNNFLLPYHVPMNNTEYFNNLIRNDTVKCDGSAWIAYSIFNDGIEAQKDITVDRGSKIYAKTRSKTGGLTAKDSSLQKVVVQTKATLDNTTAKTVNVKEGSLTIQFRDQDTLPNFESLKAKLGIDLTNIAANEVVSSEGKVSATHCRFENISSSQDVELKDTHMIGSLHIEIDPKKECRLILNGSTIEGDIVINARVAAEVINTPMVAHDVQNALGGLIGSAKTLTVESQVPRGAVQINLPGCFHNCKNFAEIPEWAFMFFTSSLKEGQRIKIDKFDCIFKDGKVSEVEKKQPVKSENSEQKHTWQQLKQEIQSLFGPGTYTKRLDYKSGIFRIVNGVPSIIQAPLGMEHVEARVIIQGGNINGGVIFKGCEGKVEHQPDQRDEASLQEAKNLSTSQEEEAEPDDDFVDPVSFTVIKDPYRTPAVPQTHAFDYSTLVELCEGTKTFVCPLTRATYRLADCVPDLILKERIQKEWIERTAV